MEVPPLCWVVYDSIIRKKEGKYNCHKGVSNNRREGGAESSGKREKKWDGNNRKEKLGNVAVINEKDTTHFRVWCLFMNCGDRI